MSALFTIGILVLTVKMAALALKVTWGLIKAVLVVIGLPVILVVLFVGGLVTAAVPLLIIALLAAFFLPAVRGI